MTELRIDALLPAEMARRAEYIGERKSEAAGGRVHRLWRDLCHHHRNRRIWRPVLRRYKIIGRISFLFGTGARHRWRRRAFYRQQPDRDGMGKRKGEHKSLITQLGHRLCGKLRWVARDCRLALCK